jgi:hypothetical protein
MSAALSIILALGLALMVMLQQHVQFMEMFRRQSFLAADAPKIGNLLGRILNHADHYFVYASKADALAGAKPVLAGGRAVRLFFKSAAQVTEERLIAVEATATGNALRFYGSRLDGTATSWTISNRITDAQFTSSQGILNITLDGPNGEEVTYAGGAR